MPSKASNRKRARRESQEFRTTVSRAALHRPSHAVEESYRNAQAAPPDRSQRLIQQQQPRAPPSSSPYDRRPETAQCTVPVLASRAAPATPSPSRPGSAPSPTAHQDVNQPAPDPNANPNPHPDTIPPGRAAEIRAVLHADPVFGMMLQTVAWCADFFLRHPDVGLYEEVVPPLMEQAIADLRERNLGRLFESEGVERRQGEGQGGCEGRSDGNGVGVSEDPEEKLGQGFQGQGLEGQAEGQRQVEDQHVSHGGVKMDLDWDWETDEGRRKLTWPEHRKRY